MAFFPTIPRGSVARPVQSSKAPPLTATGVPSVLPVSSFTLSVEQVAAPVKALLGNWKFWAALGVFAAAGVVFYKVKK